MHTKHAGEYATRLGYPTIRPSSKKEGSKKSWGKEETIDEMRCARYMRMQIRDDDHGDHPFCG